MNYNYTPIKIAIADDHHIFREGFKILLKNQPELELVGEAEDGRELLEIAQQLQPDVVVIDIKMPVMNGIETCKHLCRRFPEIKVIALSMFNDDNLIVDMLEAGAKGYLLKNTNKHELLQAVKAVHEGGTYYCTATSAKLTKMIAESKFNPYRSQPIKKFTPRETDIITLMCKQYTNKEIARQAPVKYPHSRKPSRKNTGKRSARRIRSGWLSMPSSIIYSKYSWLKEHKKTPSGKKGF